ncbi:uncharacterized protein EI90DRAFT_3013175 [Cantharellus anzutake]|uniref:uncharacterized protein n=1 Tax=Cantharellus anzutake TaxID=1750568 RepID=UPI0019065B11|nr:uncharacterized protein EI90DRAFT_3013175 [Cantharellus anzutake]KAF8339121.1 hypothetical protein EI90DRAFT_3013175 [Cantharellus anzutake]
MHKLKWIPVEELSRKELNKQKQLINQCMNQNPEFLEQLVEEHGPFPLLWDFNVAARARVQGCSKRVKGPALTVTRSEHPMGLHSREAVRAAIESHRPVVGCHAGPSTAFAVPLRPDLPIPKPLPGAVAVPLHVHGQHASTPFSWVQPGPAAPWTRPTLLQPFPIPPPPPLPFPQLPTRPPPTLPIQTPRVIKCGPRTHHLLSFLLVKFVIRVLNSGIFVEVQELAPTLYGY